MQYVVEALLETKLGGAGLNHNDCGLLSDSSGSHGQPKDNVDFVGPWDQY